MSDNCVIKGTRHIGIPTCDLDKSVAFYELLGFTVDRRIEHGPADDRIAFMRAGDCMIELYESPDAVGKNGPIDHITLDVSNPDLAYQYLIENGYEPLEGSMQCNPSFDGGVKFFSVKGPNNEKIELEASINDKKLAECVTVACADPLTLSPLILTRNGKLVLHNFYEVLFELDHFNGTPYGRIGKEWHWDKDNDGNDVMRVEIYDYIYDHEGNHYTANDTYFCYMTDWNAGYLQNFGYYIKEIRVLDDYHLDFVVNPGKKDALLIEYCVLGKCLQYTRTAYEASKDHLATSPVGTGRYVLEEYIPGVSLTSRLADSYWQKESLCKEFQKANVKKITWKFIVDNDERAAALKSGEVDCVGNIAIRHVDELEKDSRFIVESWLQDTVVYLLPNCRKGYPCEDENLRAAIFYSCDSEAFVEACGGERKAVRTYCFGTPGIGNYNKAWETMDNYYTKCDLKLAEEYLHKSDYHGETLKIIYESGEFGEYYKACAEVVASSLKKLGIPCNMTEVDSEQMRYNWIKAPEKWDLCISAWASQDNMANFYDKIYDRNFFSSDYGAAGIDDPKLYDMFSHLYCKSGNTQENIDTFHLYETEHCYSYGLFQPRCYDVFRKDIIRKISKNERLWLMPSSFEYKI